MNEQIQQVTKALVANRQRESEIFRGIEGDLDSWLGVNLAYLGEQSSVLERMYQSWDSQVRELRRLYEAVGESPDRAMPYGPNRDMRRQLYDRLSPGR